MGVSVCDGTPAFRLNGPALGTPAQSLRTITTPPRRFFADAWAARSANTPSTIKNTQPPVM